MAVESVPIRCPGCGQVMAEETPQGVFIKHQGRKWLAAALVAFYCPDCRKWSHPRRGRLFGAE